MSAQANLLQLYKDWRALTEDEREAIEEGDWRRVRVCQGAKAQLQPEIVRATERTHSEWRQSGIDSAILEKQVRSAVNELIYLESRNGEFITEQRRAAQAEFEQLDQSVRTVGKIQKSYAPSAPIAWETYS